MAFKYEILGDNIIKLFNNGKDLGILKLPYEDNCIDSVHETDMYKYVNDRCPCFIQLLYHGWIDIHEISSIASGSHNVKYIEIKVGNESLSLNSYLYKELLNFNKSSIHIIFFASDVLNTDVHQIVIKDMNIHDMTKRILTALNYINVYLRPMNFIHGDLKINNILGKQSCYDIKFIDLEGSLICDKSIILLCDKSNMLNAYLSVSGLISKEFLFIFDIVVLIFSILTVLRLHFTTFVNLCKDELKNNKDAIKNMAFMDAFVLTLILNTTSCDGKTYMINGVKQDIIRKSDNCLNATFDTILTLFSINVEFEDKRVNDHFLKMKNIADKCNSKNIINAMLESMLSKISEPSLFSKLESNLQKSSDSLTLSPDESLMF